MSSAGISNRLRSSVLYYFASREAVLIEAVRHAETALAGARSQELRAAEDPSATSSPC